MKGIIVRKLPLLPMKGFAAITIFPFIFVDKSVKKWTDLDKRKVLINHENIHINQQLEMLIIPFYLFYFIEWIIKSFIYKGMFEGYKNISFEREAYGNEDNENYLKERSLFSWFNYIKKS